MKLSKININIKIKLLLFYIIKMVIIIILIWVAASYPCVYGLVWSTLDVVVIDVG
jgi:hypothetical protein